MANDVITFLPDEIIAYILEDNHIEFLDVVRFGLTCKHLYKVVNSNNKLWRTKFFQRWPLLKEVYCQEIEKSGNKVLNWKDEVQASVNSRCKLLHQLSLMSSKNYIKQELPDSELRQFDSLFRYEEGAHPLGYYFLVDELISFIKRPAAASNLTHRYYAFKVVRYLKQNYLKNEWQQFISLPPKEQILERGATLVAQWSQPERHILYSYISSLLDKIAEQTKALLRENYPKHSIFSASKEQLALWKSNNIDDNQWSITETRQLMDALCKILFQKLGFHGNNEMYYSSENLFMDRVLEHRRGIPITLAIVFESVARRLGIRCEPVSFPSHFLLRWRETYSNPEAKDVENFYIDVFNGGQFLTKKDCIRIGGVSKCPIEKYNVHKAAAAIEVVTRMANNLEIAARQHNYLNGRTARLRSALELRYMIQPLDTNAILQLGRFYIFHQMDLTDIVKTLESMQRDLELTVRGQVNLLLQTLQMLQKDLQPEEPVEPKKRMPGVKYAIGLIMRHKTNAYLCVITGWDLRCEASTEWMNEMNVDQLEHGADQPFYNVFVDDGSSRYAAQENLLLAPVPEWINHYEIGRYFCKFGGTHYVPNEEKAKEYPEDEDKIGCTPTNILDLGPRISLGVKVPFSHNGKYLIKQGYRYGAEPGVDIIFLFKAEEPDIFDEIDDKSKQKVTRDLFLLQSPQSQHDGVNF